MADARSPRKKKAARDAAGELRRPDAADELRGRAEERLDGLSAAAMSAPEDLAAAVHELRVHQIELEMQNEELRRAQLEAEALREKYAELFRLAPVGYFTSTDKGIVEDVNGTAARLLGVRRETLKGQPFSAFVFAADRDAYYRYRALLKQTRTPRGCDLRLQPVGAEPFWAHLDGRPQGAVDGEQPRYRLTFTDVHERILAEEALRESEEKYRIVADNTYDWEWWTAPDGSYLYISPGCERVTGHSAPEFVADPGLLLAIAHPDDRDRLRDHLTSGATDESAEDELVFRIRTPAGDERVVDHRCRTVHDAGGAYLGRRASNRDITARRRAVHQLEERAKELQALYGLAEIAERQGLTLDELYQELTDILPASWQYPRVACARTVIGDRELRTKDFTESAWMQSAPVTVKGSVVGRLEVGYREEMPNEDEGPFLKEERQLIDSLAERLGRIIERKQAEEDVRQRNQQLARPNADLVDETAALAEANATITRVAATDDLTGLANRRRFYESLATAVSLARRHGSPLALVSLDLDGLKRVNDSAGHEAGDEVLTSFADLLGALCRAEDLPSRLGGDEFGVLLPGIALDGAQSFAERLLVAVRSCEVLAQRGVTVSAGVAQWAPGELPDDLLRRADQALYAAKRGGGDAVTGGG